MSQTKEQADFATIRANVTMQMLLDHYHITDLKQRGQELRSKCPLPGCGTGERPFQVNTVKNVFHCFACSAGGNVIDFVAKMESCSIREAGLKIWGWFNLGNPTATPPAQEQPEGPSPDQQPEIEPTPQDFFEVLNQILIELQMIRKHLADRG